MDGWAVDCVYNICVCILGTLKGMAYTHTSPPTHQQPKKASVKGLTPQQLRDANTQIILSNTYHLLLQPGSELVAGTNGLRRL